MKKLILVDFGNIICRGIAVNPNLKNSDNIFTGGLYGFIKQISKIIDIVGKNTQVVVCMDSPPYLRSNIYSGYKENRTVNKNSPVTKERIFISKKQVIEFLGFVGIPVWYYEGLEADDLIALSIDIHSHYDEIVILSNDDDLLQLLKYKNVRIYRGVKKGFIDYNGFKNEYGIEPKQWIDVLAMAGTHNNVMGVKGIGIKTAIKILLNEHKMNKFLVQYRKLFDLNSFLIELPFNNSRVISLAKDRFYYSTVKYNEERTIQHLSRFDIKLTQDMSKSFSYIGT